MLGWRKSGRARLSVSKIGLPVRMAKGGVLGAFVGASNSSCLNGIVEKSDGKGWMVLVGGGEASL
jgi:hypothetical protein